MTGNREVKSDVFGMLLEDPKRALEIYNGLNHSDYKDPNQVEICTLERGISLSVRNDASFFLGTDLNIYEHESTVCPNMPLRDLIYVTNILEQWVRSQNIYGRRLVKIPTPHFAVFYNGTEEQPEQYELRLSDAFLGQEGEPELELICKVYNINKGKNRELMEKCPTLKEYAIFVDYVRRYQAECTDLKEAIETAIDRCISENILREFLKERRGEVTKMTQLDYTFERRLELERQERERELELERQEWKRELELERQKSEKEILKLQEELEHYKRAAERSKG